MKLKKIIAAVAAAAVAVSAMAVSAFATDLTAYLQFADSDWYPSTWMSDPEPTSTTITGNGTYTISFAPADAIDGAVVFVLDIADVYEAGKDGAKLYENFDVTVDSVTVDGTSVPVVASSIITGHIEDDTTNYRVELYNEYGDTKSSPAVESDSISGSTLEVTFTVSGLDDATASDTAADTTADTTDATPAADTTTDSSSTGNTAAAVMLSVMAVAGIAAVATKKRK